MDIDHKGRVWVCESVNYRDTLHHRPLRRPAGDRIVILEDTSGVGKADKATTFYQAPELLAPLGIAVAKNPVGPGYKVRGLNPKNPHPNPLPEGEGVRFWSPLPPGEGSGEGLPRETKRPRSRPAAREPAWTCTT